MKKVTFEKFVLDTIIKDIQDTFFIKTKKEARTLFINALSANVVGAEIYSQVEWLIDNPEEVQEL